MTDRGGKGSDLRKFDPYRLVVLGGFGFDNLGDDLILRSALAQLRKILGNVEIAILSNNPFETASRHRGELVVFSVEALLRQIILRALSYVSSYHRRYLLPIPGDSFRRSLTYLWKSDLVVSLGGGYLNDYSKFLTHSRLMELILVGLFRKRLFLYGHEIGPLRRLSLRLLARVAMRFITYATVRNHTSLRVILGLGISDERVKVTADEAWTYNPKISPASRSHQSGSRNDLAVAVNLMPFEVLSNVFRLTTTKPLEPEKLNDHILSVVLSSLDSFTSRRLRLLLLPASMSDFAVCSKLQARLRGRVPCEIVRGLDSQYTALTRSHVLVAMRMHTIIMAAQVGVPPVAIAVLPKVFGAMESIGLSGYVVQGLQLDAKALQDALNRALQNANNIRTLMSERAMSLREKASLNAKLVGGLLKATQPVGSGI
jgi:polysaccharide pyruvyl transferase WcaK-like protein